MANIYKSPGTYWENTLFKDKVVPLVGQAAISILGITQKGDISKPIEVNSWDEFVRKCGTFFTPVGITDIPLAYSVYEWFRNRGTRLYIGRVTHRVAGVSQAVKSSLTLLDRATTPLSTLKVEAASEGEWGDDISITVADNPRASTTLSNGVSSGYVISVNSLVGFVVGSNIRIKEGATEHYASITSINATAKTLTLDTVIVGSFTIAATVVTREFDLKVYYNDVLQEQYIQYSMVTTDDRYIAAIVSDWIVVTDLNSATTPGLDLPAAITDQNLAGGDDALASLVDADYVGDPTYKSGFYMFSQRPTDTIRLAMAAPSRATAAVAVGGFTYCVARGDCYFVADVPSNSITGSAVVTYKNTTVGVDSTYGCFAFPHAKVLDQLIPNAKKSIAPSIYKLATFNYWDNARGPWKAAAGTEFPLQGIIELAVEVDQTLQDTLNDANVQCIRYINGAGYTMWGARTASTQLRYRYENVIRTIQYVGERATKENLANVFEIGDPQLRAAITDTLSNICLELYKKRALRGAAKEEAYFVICDTSNNTDQTLDQGVVYCDVGMSINKPAEFIVFRIGVWESGAVTTTLA